MGLIEFEFGSFYKRSESDIFREEVSMALEMGYSPILGLYTIFNVTINCSDGIVFTHSSVPISIDNLGSLNLFIRDILQPK
jgi:hypothetical protein